MSSELSVSNYILAAANNVILCYARFALNYFNDTHCIYFPLM